MVDPVIRPGDSGERVRDVQRRLRALGNPDLAVDGRFGERTRQAVLRFQQERGLGADGIVGPETWQDLVEAGWRLGTRLLWYSQQMMRGDDVRELQHRLNQLGFDAGTEDGIFGPLARSAVEEFQRNVGLAVDGVAGPETVGLLRRFERAHQSGGLGVRAREREWLRRLAGRGLTGTRIVVDPAHGAADPGAVGPGGTTEAEVAWEIGSRLAGRLSAQGAVPLLTRGPATNPDPAERGQLANELGAELVLAIAVNAHDNPRARGASAYYYGAPEFTSEAGRLLAELAQEEMVAAGWQPDCRTHPMTWSILRETRMPAAVVEPGFITCPDDEARLADPREQDRLADALTRAVARLLTSPLATAS